MNRINAALSRIPRAVSLELTTKCNLNCVYCTKKSKELGNIDINPQLLDIIKGQLDAYDHVVICGIGESFCYPGLYGFLHELDGKKISIVTNGTILINYEELNDKNNVEQLIFSIDAIEPELMKTICGQFNWDHLMKNLENLISYRKASKKIINSILNCTINNFNLSQLVKLADFAKKYRFTAIHFSFPRGYEEFISQNQDILNKTLGETKRKAFALGLYYADPYEPCCVFLKWIVPYISIQGIVYACAETLYLDQKLADLRELTLDNVWTLEKYNDFREGKACKKCRFLLNCNMKF
jgi:radical SAM protein with 4Fe4S-binding SPASM domain